MLVLGLSLIQTSCYGPFKLTKKVYEWNGTVGSKFVNNLVFWGCVIIPVYDVAMFIDAVVFNTIEFWGGKNPISMNENEKEIKTVQANGKEYMIIGSKNKFHVEQVKGPNKGYTADFIYSPIEYSWYLEANNHTIRLDN